MIDDGELDIVEARVLRRARRAYERSRLAAAARVCLYVAPVVAASALASGDLVQVVIVGAGATVLAVLCLWRGGSMQATVGAGFIGGGAGFAVPLLFQSWGSACTGEACSTYCGAAALAGGVLAVIVARHRAANATRDTGARAAGDRRGGGWTADAPVAIAILLGLLGALITGAASVLGFIAGAVAAFCIDKLVPGR